MDTGVRGRIALVGEDRMLATSNGKVQWSALDRPHGGVQHQAASRFRAKAIIELAKAAAASGYVDGRPSHEGRGMCS